MQKFLAYLENKEFVRWVYTPGEQNISYWKGYQENHPEEAELIREARAILLQLKSKSDVSHNQIDALLPKIMEEIRHKERLLKTKQILFQSFKYAAIAILFFTIGIYLMEERYQESINEMSRQFANISAFNGQESRLVLADGKSIIINEKSSQIRYCKNGTLILDQKDTIQQHIPNTASKVNQLIVPFGKSSSIVLADGTVAYLNAGSRLIFPPFFEGKTREVFLTGEGYFKVAHNPKIPFIVKTTDLDVRAVGTSFNVSAYPTEKKIEIVLAEGKVNITKNNFTLFHSTKDMNPNDMICYNKQTSEMECKEVRTENYISWHLGYINFESVELHKVITKLERYYDVTIEFGNPQTAKKKITGKLKLKTNIDEILRILAATSTLKIKKINAHEYLLN